MRAALWPDEDPDLLAHQTLAQFAEGAPRQIVLVAENSSGRLVGFLEMKLRAFAEGCTSSPTPFVEAWYVAAEARHQGAGRALMEAAENWARLRGFSEIASDTQMENAVGQAAHAALGYTETARIVCYRKPLKV